MAKLTNPVPASVTGNVTLSTGCHYWKVKIDQFLGNNNNGFVAVGIAKELEDGTSIGNPKSCKTAARNVPTLRPPTKLDCYNFPCLISPTMLSLHVHFVFCSSLSDPSRKKFGFGEQTEIAQW